MSASEWCWRLVGVQHILRKQETLRSHTQKLLWQKSTRDARVPKNFFVSTGYQMIVAGVLLLIISLGLQETWSLPIKWSLQAQLSVVGLILFGGILAFTAFNFLLKNVSPEKVATSAYVNPVVAMILGWYVLDEQLSNQSIIASVVLLTGVYFITSRKRR